MKLIKLFFFFCKVVLVVLNEDFYIVFIVSKERLICFFILDFIEIGIDIGVGQVFFFELKMIMLICQFIKGSVKWEN